MSDQQKSDFILYTAPDGDIKIEVFFQGETIWLTQRRMAELFGVDVRTINEHLGNIYQTDELSEDSTIRNFRIVQTEGGREVKRDVNFYNLDAIISVGYRVNSRQATHFRRWATETLTNYIIKGFAIDDERLKNGTYFGKDYFQELLGVVRSIRASEARIYKQITDIFRECSIDYDANSDITKNFYATVQNKFHYAIAGKTAAEIIHSSADHSKPNMGLTSWRRGPKGRIIKKDTETAKNYLTESEIKKLERTVSSYFDYIENQIEMENTFTMEELSGSVNAFLSFNKFDILDGKGSISHDRAIKKAHAEYDIFNKTQLVDSDFDKVVKKIQSKAVSDDK